MTTPAHAAVVETILVSAVDHFTGSRITRQTWQATLVLADGTEIACGHYMHPTTDAAARCGRALARTRPAAS